MQFSCRHRERGLTTVCMPGRIMNYNGSKVSAKLSKGQVCTSWGRYASHHPYITLLAIYITG